MSLEQALPKTGDIVAGKYVIDGVLGSGGMGAVYRVTHRVTGKAFAIKWLLPELRTETDAVNRFIREAQVAGRVDHSNVVEVYDVGQEGASFYMVMELLQGESLAQRIAGKGRLTATELARILIPVTRGLSSAHSAGVIHRDLKPENIFLCRESEGRDTPKVLDFGISKMSALGNEVQTGITRQGAVMGTPHYMAPEQMRSLPVDARTDVYALGVIMYQALSGVVPFPGDHYPDLVVKILSESPKPLASLAPDAPPELIALVERAMARDPAQRPSSAQELGIALQPFAAGMRYESGRPSTPQKPQVAAPGPQTPLATESHVAIAQSPPKAAALPKPIVMAGAGGALAVAIGLLLWLNSTPARPPVPNAGASHAAASGVAEVKPPEAPPPADGASQNDVLPTPHTVSESPAPELPHGVEPSQEALRDVSQPMASPELPVPPPTGAAPRKPKAPRAPGNSAPVRRTVPLTVDDF